MNLAKWARRLLLIFLGLVLIGAVQVDYQKELKEYQQTIKKEQQDLKALREQLRRHRQLAKTKKKEEGSVLKQIHQVEQKIDHARQDYHGHQKNLTLVRSKINYLNTLIAQNQSEINQMKKILDKRVRLIYREKSIGFWQILASSQSLGEMLRRTKFFHTLAVQNAYLLEKLNQREMTLLEQQAQLFNRKAKAEELQSATKRTLDQVKQHRRQREKILKRVRQERKLHEQATKELAVASRKLTRLIRKLESTAAKIRKKMKLTGDEFIRLKGILPWPTRGLVVRSFGKIKHPRFNTYIHHKGIDIAGTMGQNVNAIAKGYVLFAEWFEGFGRMIILDHGRGYNSVYAHLSEINVTAGETIKPGQLIGQLGDSGNWRGPALYFEIRKQGRAIDPTSWLER